MNILITGGTGFIGAELCPMLLKEGHYLKIITRHPQKHRDEQAKNQQFIDWDADLVESMEWADAVINLVGENIFGQRWTGEVKDRIYSSRVDNTKKLVEAIAETGEPPEVMISGSAVGYYAGRGTDILDEKEPPGSEFLSKVCIDWEEAAIPAKKHGVRLVISRTGIVLEKGGGVLQQMQPPFKYYVGGPIGSGDQFVPWIHRCDLCRAFHFFLNDESSGVFNVAAPNPVTMKELANALGEMMNRPSFMRVPEFVLKLGLGEAANPILDSLRIQPKGLQQADFEFKFSYIKEALSDIL